MGHTLAEKILSERSGREVKAGDLVVAEINWALMQDGTGPLAVRSWMELGIRKVTKPDKVIIFIDHASPSPRKELSNDHILLRNFSHQTGVTLKDVGEGVCHQIMFEEFVNPGEILVGADSHTCTAGGLCCLGTGMGSTDIGVAIALGKTWFRVPSSIKIIVEGDFLAGVYPKDLILHIISVLGCDGATYKALEFCGSTIEKMDISGRLTLCNMAVEAGGKTGLVPSDERTREFLNSVGRGDKYRKLESDIDAEYEKVLEINVKDLVPKIALPHNVDNVKDVEKIEKEDIKVDQVFIGTCTNGRIEDFEIAAKVWEGKTKNPSTRVIIAPASRKVLLEMVRRGFLEKFIEFGAVVIGPGCGPCVGVHSGILGDGENCVSTQNRNFLGRMGNPKGNIFLSSPATAAACAVAGKIVDPREYL